MLNTFAAQWRALLLGGLLIITLASCTTAATRTSAQLQSHVIKDPAAAERVNAWLQLRESLRGQTLSELEKVARVNNFVNSLAWRSDLENWGVEDYWATPLETLLRGFGDCEDLAIAKYFTLLEAGVEEQRLRLSYVWHWQEGQREAHIVLAYYAEDGGEALILDNLDSQTRTLAERHDLEKVYSFNRWHLWLADDAQQALAIASQDRLPHWREVNERMQSESQPFVAVIN